MVDGALPEWDEVHETTVEHTSEESTGVRADPVVSGIVGRPGRDTAEFAGGVVPQHLPIAIGATAVEIWDEEDVSSVKYGPPKPTRIGADAICP